jgi:hypothetical protein
MVGGFAKIGLCRRFNIGIDHAALNFKMQRKDKNRDPYVIGY